MVERMANAPSVPTNTLHPLADGVFVWLQPGGESGVSNAGVIVDDDGITVIDTLMVRAQWEPFAAAVNALEMPIRRLVLTHAHIDHVGGTRAFPNAAVFGSQQTSDLLDFTEMPIDAYKSFMPAFTEGFDELAEIGCRKVTHLVTDAALLTSRAELLPASGHTSGDVMVLVDDADVLFAGDLCFFGVTPLAFQGNPATWAATLDAIADLATTIVPGHGPIGDADDVRVLADYLRHCVDGAIPPGPWDGWLERAERDPINIERAALLRDGRDEMPPAMLKALSIAPASPGAASFLRPRLTPPSLPGDSGRRS
jgi:glyoxylase-like metal-dependent hydrolase (beta-lactamase superfamily II)